MLELSLDDEFDLDVAPVFERVVANGEVDEMSKGLSSWLEPPEK
jgi:hypothetical protein